MKNKKHAKKNRTTRNNSGYTPGRNMFGEKAETHLIVLKRETAFEQMMDCTCQLDGSKTIEFTYDCSCFIGHMDELEAVVEKVWMFTNMRAKILGMPSCDYFKKTA